MMQASEYLWLASASHVEPKIVELLSGSRLNFSQRAESAIRVYFATTASDILLPSMALRDAALRMPAGISLGKATGMSKLRIAEELVKHTSMDSDAWIEALAYRRIDFAFRYLACAFSRLAECFEHPATIVDISFFGQETHNQGQVPFAIEVAGGGKFVYKAVSSTWQLALSAAGQLLQTGTPSIEWREILEGEHDWCLMRYVEHSPYTHDPNTFFAKMGALIAVAHVLRITDAHFENLVATTSGPVLIDLETTLYPYGKDKSPDVTWTGLIGKYFHSAIGGGGDVWKIGVTSKSEAQTGLRVRYRVKEHVDQNRLRSRKDGLPVRPADFSRFVVGGFEAAYSDLSSQKQGLISAIGAICDRQSSRVRVLPRLTAQYVLTGLELIQPRSEASDEHRASAMDALFEQPHMVDRMTPAIKTAEREDLFDGDVPYFEVESRSKDLLHRGHVIEPDYFSQSPFEEFESHVDSLCMDDCRRQVHLIQECLEVAP